MMAMIVRYLKPAPFNNISRHSGRKYPFIFRFVFFAIGFFALSAVSLNGRGQSVLVNWTFPNNPDDKYADNGTSLNYDAAFPSNSKQITSSNTILYTYAGYTTYCAYATGWDGGSSSKYWQVEVNTSGYNALTISSRQRSSSSGPKDWKIQYKIGAGVWTDASISVTVGDNWTTGVVSSVSLPGACENQSSVYLRWIMTSNTSVGGGTVAGGGSSRIDNIIITGSTTNTLTTGAISGSPFCVSFTSGTAVTVPFTSTGTFNSANIYTAQLSDASGGFSNPIDIGSLASTANAGNISSTIPASTPDGSGYRIRVVSSDPSIIAADNGVNLRVYLNTPEAVNFNALTGNGQVTLGWTNPAGCFDDMLIVAKNNSNVDPGVPSGDGSSYTANLTYSSGSSLLGGYVVYKGSTGGQTVTNLINGTICFFKIFVRKGTTWSPGVEISATPSTTVVGDYRTRATGSWTVNTTWQKYDGAVWQNCSSGDYPNLNTAVTTIKNGHTVTLNSSPMKVKDLIVESGATLYCNSIPNGSNNNYVSIYGNNLICNGTIGNGTTSDAIGFNIEGSNVTISGTGTFDANRIRKNFNAGSTPAAAATTNLVIAMNINLRWSAASGTQVYNNIASVFNITINSGITLNLVTSGGNTGNASINKTGGTGGDCGGTWTINGTMNVPGILYATTSSNVRSAKWIINDGGIVNCNQVNCDASGTAGHTIQIMNGGKLNMTTNSGFANFSLTNNTYDFQDGSIVEYSSSTGTQTIQPTQTGFEYSNLLISTAGATKQVSSSSDLKVKKNLTITGGVFDPNGKIIYVGGDWNNYSQSGFLEGTSTVDFNGTSDQNIYCTGGEIFNKLVFSSSGTKTINDDITTNSDLTISGSAVLNGNSKNIIVKGNWTDWGAGGFTEANTYVLFNGTTQALTCSGGENFYNLENATTLTLNNSTSISNNLFLTSGKINTVSNEVNVTNSATNAIQNHFFDQSVSNYTSSAYINGNLKRNVSSTGFYDFPVGTSSYYELANVNLNSSSGISNITASFITPVDGTAPNLTVNGTTINTLLDAGYWIIAPDAYTGVSYDVTASSVGHSNGGGTASQYTLLKRANSGDNWSDLGTHNNATQTIYGSGATEVITAKRTLYNAFSHFGIGKGNAPLPIELIYFDASCNQNDVVLSWATASETNNDFFTVEKCSDLINWNILMTIQGSGNSEYLLNYSYTDNEIADGAVYYRLKQTDYDGNYEYFGPISVSCSDLKDNSFSLFPNPADQQVICSITSSEASTALIEVSNYLGQKMITSYQNIIKGSNNILLDISYLPAGIYSVAASTADGSMFQSKQLIVQ